MIGFQYEKYRYTIKNLFLFLAHSLENQHFFSSFLYFKNAQEHGN